MNIYIILLLKNSSFLMKSWYNFPRNIKKNPKLTPNIIAKYIQYVQNILDQSHVNKPSSFATTIKAWIYANNLNKTSIFLYIML